jgi:Domain of unknown function (DUF4928)
MREYVALLNRIHSDERVDLQAIEAFWVARVQEFFAAKPFRVRLDASSSLRLVVRDILEQAEERQKAAFGVWYVGAVMQHMVGAKLDCALGPGKFQHNSFTTSDEQSGRKGDFFVGDVAIHVTTSPGEAAIQRCSDNLNDGHRPILVTRQRGLTVAEALAENVGLEDRIDIFEIEQFIALNLYEMGKFLMEGRRAVLKDFVTRYNEIIDEVETDPSLESRFLFARESSSRDQEQAKQIGYRHPEQPPKIGDQAIWPRRGLLRAPAPLHLGRDAGTGLLPSLRWGALPPSRRRRLPACRSNGPAELDSRFDR